MNYTANIADNGLMTNDFKLEGCFDDQENKKL